jgi:hypothetical protein
MTAKSSGELQGNHWSPYAVFNTEGARCALTSCLICGALILCDPRSDRDFREIHAAWHAAFRAVPGLR